MNISMSCDTNETPATTAAEIWITVLTFATLVLTTLLGLYKARKIHKKGRDLVSDEEIGEANLPLISRRVYKIHHNVERILKELALSKTSDPS
jgi:hypothetical protein